MRLQTAGPLVTKQGFCAGVTVCVAASVGAHPRTEKYRPGIESFFVFLLTCPSSPGAIGIVVSVPPDFPLMVCQSSSMRQASWCRTASAIISPEALQQATDWGEKASIQKTKHSRTTYIGILKSGLVHTNFVHLGRFDIGANLYFVGANQVLTRIIPPKNDQELAKGGECTFCPKSNWWQPLAAIVYLPGARICRLDIQNLNTHSVQLCTIFLESPALITPVCAVYINRPLQI